MDANQRTKRVGGLEPHDQKSVLIYYNIIIDHYRYKSKENHGSKKVVRLFNGTRINRDRCPSVRFGGYLETPKGSTNSWSHNVLGIPSQPS